MNGPGTARYPNIFSALKVGSASCRNRVKYAACSVSNFNTRDGSITDREYARMEVIAGTGAGMITNQGAYPDPEGAGKAYYRQLSIADDKYIPGFRKIADMLHRGGAIAIQQILPIPRKARQQLLTDLEFVCDELYAIGDAVKPRSMHNAIREGYLIGIRI